MIRKYSCSLKVIHLLHLYRSMVVCTNPHLLCILNLVQYLILKDFSLKRRHGISTLKTFTFEYDIKGSVHSKVLMCRCIGRSSFLIYIPVNVVFLIGLQSSKTRCIKKPLSDHLPISTNCEVSLKPFSQFFVMLEQSVTQRWPGEERRNKGETV